MMGDWTFKGRPIRTKKDMPEDVFGFIYMITNISKGKFYIGEKRLFHVTNPAISKTKYDFLKKQGEPVTKTKHKKKSKRGAPHWIYKRKNVKTETNWKDYTGSSEELNADIESGDTIERRIICFTMSKKEHTFREIEQIIKHDCLTIESCRCYNKNILGKFFELNKCED